MVEVYRLVDFGYTLLAHRQPALRYAYTISSARRRASLGDVPASAAASVRPPPPPLAPPLAPALRRAMLALRLADAAPSATRAAASAIASRGRGTLPPGRNDIEPKLGRRAWPAQPVSGARPFEPSADCRRRERCSSECRILACSCRMVSSEWAWAWW